MRACGALRRCCALLAVVAKGSVAAAPYTGRWSGELKGLPNSKLASVPTLGNGYLGLVIGTHQSGSALHPTTSIDWWLNTNAMWSCSSNPQNFSLPPAVCNRVALGGVSIVLPAAFAVAGDSAAFKGSSLSAEQRITDGQLYTRSVSAAGSVLETLTWMHPDTNVVATNVTYTSAGGDPSSIELNASVWIAGGKGAPVAPNCTSSGCVAVAFRTVGPANSTTVRSVTTAVALSLPSTARVSSGSTVTMVTAVADTLVAWPAPHDPSADAAAAATAPGAASEALSAASAFWSAFWARSTVRFPQLPELEAYWHGAQYVMAGMSASAAMEARFGGLVPPSGLYGPWVTSDSPAWNGDYTLDYNQEAQFYGVFSSNHPELSEAYFAPITDWMPAARIAAKKHAAAANISCPGNALHYACHLAPWGYQSRDQSTYMHWNGAFASLLFINRWEYTRNVSWARETAYPLLDGLNAWWSCFLIKVPDGGSGGGGYVYHDSNALDPDNEHENQKVADPQIGLALIRRTMSAQLDMAAAIGVEPPAHVADILSHLAPFNTAVQAPSPPPPPPPAPVNCSDTGRFTTEPGTRCTGDKGMSRADTVDCCRAWCNADPACDAFTYCSSPGCHAGSGEHSCWKYHAGASCSPGTGFMSGHRVKAASGRRVAGGAAGDDGTNDAPVWTSYANATVRQSDGFSLYPLWPSEMIGLDSNEADLRVARASLVAYSNPFGINDRPVLVHPAAVRTGGCPPGAAHSAIAGPIGCRNASGILAAMLAWLTSDQQPSFIPTAPGGGTENVGVTQAVNDMLVQAPNGRYIALFPVWPRDLDASFDHLLTKGAFEVSAAWSASDAAVANVSVASLTGTPCTLLSPWMGRTEVSVTCGGGQPTTARVNSSGFVTFDAPKGAPCAVSPAAE